MKRYLHIVLFTLGVIVGLISCFIIVNLSSLSAADNIDIISIVVNVFLGIAIVLIIEKRLSDDRGVKDYLIDEVCSIRDEYSKFVNLLFRGKAKHHHILEWFKYMSIRISHLEYFLKKELEIKDIAMPVLNRQLHKLITDSQEFNNSFSAKSYVMSVSMKNQNNGGL